MRIAICGAHGAGKTTLIEDFLECHGDYVHEPEPYEWLEDVAEEPAIDDFRRQLEISVERLAHYDAGANVIAERSPADFVAYILAMKDLRRCTVDDDFLAAAVELAVAGLERIDLLVVLPLDAGSPEIPESEDIALRESMNDQLLDIVHRYFRDGPAVIAEISGTRGERLRHLEELVRGPIRSR